MDYYSEYYNQLHEYIPGEYFYKLCAEIHPKKAIEAKELLDIGEPTVTVYGLDNRFRIGISKHIRQRLGSYVNIQLTGSKCFIYVGAKYEIKNNCIANKDLHVKLRNHFKCEHTFTLFGKEVLFRDAIGFELKLI